MTLYKIKARKENVEYDDGDDFIRNCFVNLNPQSYGGKIEKRIITKNNMKKVKSTLGRGDVIDTDTYYKEIKVSLSDDGVFNIVQIRPYQDFHSYLLFFFNINQDASINKYVFEIPKNEIMKLRGINGAHGTKESNSKNKNVEYRVTIKINDENWKLLTDKYTTKKEF